jgi:hypothetical protein
MRTCTDRYWPGSRPSRRSACLPARARVRCMRLGYCLTATRICDSDTRLGYATRMLPCAACLAGRARREGLPGEAPEGKGESGERREGDRGREGERRPGGRERMRVWERGRGRGRGIESGRGRGRRRGRWRGREREGRRERKREGETGWGLGERRWGYGGSAGESQRVVDSAAPLLGYSAASRGLEWSVAQPGRMGCY